MQADKGLGSMGGPSSIHILVRGEPVAFARAGRLGKLSFTPTKQKEAMRLIGYTAMVEMGSMKPLEGVLEATMVFSYPWPKAVSKKRREAGGYWKESRPDLDNLVKLVCDALNGIVWIDDAQIVNLTAIKRYDDIPSMSVLVGPATGGVDVKSEEEVDAE